jgi:aspartate racemase
MKTLGIVGGIGPESTIAYYRYILQCYHERDQGGGSPAVIINSIDVRKMLHYVDVGDYGGLIDYLVPALKALAGGGSDMGLLAANTPHIVFEELEKRSPIPLISIVEATCARVESLGLTTVGLCGTRATMQMDFYRKVFESHGIRIEVPSLDDMNYIHHVYVHELLDGLLLTETHDRLLGIVSRMISSQHIQALILAGTELGLILREPIFEGIPLIDTTKVHASAAVSYMLSEGAC